MGDVTRASGRIEGLDALRMVLAFTVMIFHIAHFRQTVGFGPDFGEPARWWDFGRYPVEAFFIISGAVVIRSARQRSFIDFGINRIVRLAPALIICASITMIATRLVPIPQAPSLFQWLASVTVLPLTISSGADWPYWSITMELRFYIGVGVFLLFFRSTRAILAGLFAWTALSYVACLVDAPVLETAVINRGSACFIFGVAIYLIETEPKARVPAVVLAIAAAALIPLQMMEATIHRGRPEALSLPEGYMITGVIIAIVLGAYAMPHLGPFRRLARMAGAASYPLYLVHNFVSYVIIMRLVQAGVSMSVAVAVAIMTVVAVSFAISAWWEPVVGRIIKTILKGIVSFSGSAWIRVMGRRQPVASKE